MNFKFVYTDYKHLEIDGEEVGSTFKTSGVDSRLELVHQPIGLFEGSLGGQFFYKDLSILGADAFLQPTTTVAGAAFLFEEVKLGPVTLQFGGRVEHDQVSIDSSDPDLTSLTSPDQKDQDFTPLSAAGGVIYHFLDDWELAVNATFSQRAPTAEELFARGGHDATFQFIVGDPNLGVETSRGIDRQPAQESRHRHRHAQRLLQFVLRFHRLRADGRISRTVCRFSITRRRTPTSSAAKRRSISIFCP